MGPATEYFQRKHAQMIQSGAAPAPARSRILPALGGIAALGAGALGAHAAGLFGHHDVGQAAIPEAGAEPGGPMFNQEQAAIAGQEIPSHQAIGLEGTEGAGMDAYNLDTHDQNLLNHQAIGHESNMDPMLHGESSVSDHGFPSGPIGMHPASSAWGQAGNTLGALPGAAVDEFKQQAQNRIDEANAVGGAAARGLGRALGSGLSR